MFGFGSMTAAYGPVVPRYVIGTIGTAGTTGTIGTSFLPMPFTEADAFPDRFGARKSDASSDVAARIWPFGREEMSG